MILIHIDMLTNLVQAMPSTMLKTDSSDDDDDEDNDNMDDPPLPPPPSGPVPPHVGQVINKGVE
jgi:hypothetical protein